MSITCPGDLRVTGDLTVTGGVVLMGVSQACVSITSGTLTVALEGVLGVTAAAPLQTHGVLVDRKALAVLQPSPKP